MQRARGSGTLPDSAAQIQSALETLLRLHASRRVFARQAAAAGSVISQPAYALLRQIAVAESLPMGELARRTHMDPGATARQVGQLEDDGLVERFPSSDDGRVTLVTLTPAGEQAYRRVAAVRNAHFDATLSGWSERDREVFARLLTRFVDQMKARGYESPDGQA